MGEYYNDFRNCQTLEDLKIKLNRFFESFFSEIDSLNVIDLITERTTIHSQNGETQISGPLFVMKDGAGVIRLQLGYNSTTGLFTFQLYNAAGTLSIGIDSSGNGTFTGTITGSTITGGTIRTATSGARIEMSSNSLNSYNSAGTKTGASWGTGLGANYGDMSFYDGGVETMRIENQLTGTGFTIKPMGSAVLGLGAGGSTTYPYGTWNFVSAAVSNLENSGYIKGNGVSGTFKTGDTPQKTVTVANGLITSIV